MRVGATPAQAYHPLPDVFESGRTELRNIRDV